MTKNLTFIAIIAVLLGLLLFREGCRKSEVVVVKPRVDRKPTMDSTNFYRDLSQKRKGQADSTAAIKQKVRHHWHTIKHDSLIPVPVLVQVCDSALAADSVHSAMQHLVILSQDGEIKNLREVIRIDSTNHRQEVDSLKQVNKGLKKEVRRQKLQKIGILTIWAIREGVGVLGR